MRLSLGHEKGRWTNEPTRPLRGDAAALGSGSRSLRVDAPPRSPRRVARALVATAARTRGPLSGHRDGTVGRTPPGTGAAPRAVSPRARAPPRTPGSACESAAPFGAPPLQYLPAAFRRHPLAESVRLGAPATIRLKRPLHEVLLVRACAQPAHPTDALTMASSAAPSGRARRAVAARARPVLWLAARCRGVGGARQRCARDDPHGPHR
jgi:hypothetical protein